jgi:hypothetical protein
MGSHMEVPFRKVRLGVAVDSADGVFVHEGDDAVDAFVDAVYSSQPEIAVHILASVLKEKSP